MTLFKRLRRFTICGSAVLEHFRFSSNRGTAPAIRSHAIPPRTFAGIALASLAMLPAPASSEELA
ncbi:hypothetical protein AB4144_28380, partial [Rhizobiaceae sp. 2RAB30]